MPILWVYLNWCFYGRKKDFSTTYVDDLLDGNTGGYKGLQGITRGDRGWQGVTRGLQGVTGGYKGVTGGYEGFRRGYKGFEGITRGYRCLERVRGFKRGILFFFFITKVAENLNWWRKRTVETFRILPETMAIYVCMNLFVKVDPLIIVP